MMKVHSPKFDLHIIFLTLLALGLRLYSVGSQSLWFDEAYTVFVSRLPIADGWQYLVADGVHPPLYYWLIKLFLYFGDSEVVLRMPSVLFGVLSVPAVYLLGLGWLGKKGALVSALLLTISPFSIWYSQEARMYAALAFFAIIIFGLYASLLIKLSNWRIVAFVIASSLAYLTHYFALLIPCVELVHIIINLKRYPRFIRSWTVMQVVSVLPLLLWLVVIGKRDGQFFGIGWIPQPDLIDLLYTLINFTVGYTTRLSPIHWLVLAICLIFVFIGLRYDWKFPPAKSLTIIWTFLPLVLIFVLSQMRPIYIDRFFILSQPAFLLLVGGGISFLKRNMMIISVITLFTVFVWGWTLINFGSERVEKEEWRQAGKHISQFEKPGELIVYRVLQIAIPFDYYYSGNLPTKALEANQEIYPLNEIARGYDGAWLVYWNISADAHSMTATSSFNPATEADSITAHWIAGQGPKILSQDDFPGTTIFHFEGTFE